jgi:Electron transfer DM13
MNKKLWIGVGLAAVLLVGWALFRPELLLVNRTVSEKFPAAPQSAAAGSQTPRQLLSGRFKGYAHETEGTASIYGMDSKRILRLTNFRTSNGPDVHVYLITAPELKTTQRLRCDHDRQWRVRRNSRIRTTANGIH